MNTPARLLAFLLFLASAISGMAQETAVGKCKASPLRDLGEYNDIFILENEDFVILRKGDTLYSLAMDENATPVKLVSDPSLKYTGINEGIKIHDRLWLLILSAEESPFIIDAYSGLKKELEMPGAWHTWRKTEIESMVVLTPFLDTMILQLSRRPWFNQIGKMEYLCVRVDLKNGNIFAFPENWQIDSFSTDMRTAFFKKEYNNNAFVDLPTGNTIEDLKSLPEIPLAHVYSNHGSFLRIMKNPEFELRYFEGHEKTAMPVYAYSQTEELNPPLVLQGIIINGAFISLKDKIEKTPVEPIFLNDGYLAFKEKWNSAIFIVTPVNKKGIEKITATEYPSCFQLLGNGSCIFIRFGKNKQGKSEEAFFKAYGSSPWNLLSEVDVLPEEGTTEYGKSPNALSLKTQMLYDKMDITFCRSFGSHESRRLALCKFTRSGIPDTLNAKLFGTIPILWQESMIIDSSGRRFWAHIPKTEGHIELIIHDSGNVIVQNYVHSKEHDRRERYFLIRTLKLTPEIK